MEKTLNRMAAISREIARLNEEYSNLEAEVIKRFAEDTENST